METDFDSLKNQFSVSVSVSVNSSFKKNQMDKEVNAALEVELQTSDFLPPNQTIPNLTLRSNSATEYTYTDNDHDQALDFYDSPENQIRSVPTMALQQSGHDLPVLDTFKTMEIHELEEKWENQPSKNDFETTTYAEFKVFENLRNPTKDRMAEYITRFRLITKSEYRFNKCTRGTFCCRSKAREYKNSFHIIEILLDIIILPLLIIVFLVVVVFWIIGIVYYWLLFNVPCFRLLFCCCVGSISKKKCKTQLYTIDNCILTIEPNIFEEYDFLKHRIATYFIPMLFTVPFNFIHYITGGFKYNPLITDDLLYFMLTMNPMAREVNIDEYPNCITMDFHPTTQLPPPYATEITLFPKNALVVKGCGWDIVNKRIFITVVDENGENLKIYNDKKDKKSIQLWNLAKSHIQCYASWHVVCGVCGDWYSTLQLIFDSLVLV